jgi:hypothetical protein
MRSPLRLRLTRQLHPISSPTISLVAYLQQYLKSASTKIEFLLQPQYILHVLLYLQGAMGTDIRRQAQTAAASVTSVQIRHSGLFVIRIMF